MTFAAVMQRLKRERMLTLSALAEWIAGEPIKGSWWGHRAGAEIFGLATKLDDHRDVLTMKLVGGKVTFVHRVLWPVILRVVTDEKWRHARIAKLDAASKRMLKQVELDGPTLAKGKEKKALEQSMLVLAAQQHNDTGKHVTFLHAWSRWAEAHGVEPAELTLDEALAALRT